MLSRPSSKPNVPTSGTVINVPRKLKVELYTLIVALFCEIMKRRFVLSPAFTISTGVLRPLEITAVKVGDCALDVRASKREHSRTNAVLGGSM